MSKIEKRVLVSCSLERLFIYVPESDQLPELWPGLLEVGEVQRLPLGGVMARWLYKMTGALFDDLDQRREPLIDRTAALTLLGNISCAMRWNFQTNTHAPGLTLSGDYTCWSPC
jgi:hypothetical protein